MIEFHSIDIEFKLPFDRNKLSSFLELIAQKENSKISDLNYVFTSEDYLLNINKQFLNHHFHTDIITFDNSGIFGIKGEIYISIDYIRNNYKKYSLSFKRELLRSIIHGLLHLFGYKDLSSNDKIVMRSMENYYLSLYY